MLRANQLEADRACLAVIDVQEKLLPLIASRDGVVGAACKLLEGAAVFGLPVLATVQYVKGLGPTIPEIASRLRACKAETFEKPTFSACGEATIRRALDAIDRPQIILTGIEAHVCVQQTALDLRTLDYDVFVCADAVGSRGRSDYELALSRMRQEGVWITSVESVLFELCGRCDGPWFKGLLDIIKSRPPA